MLPQIQRMAEGMQHKIDKNMHKSGWLAYDEKGNRTWNADMVAFLMRKLDEEAQELKDAAAALGNYDGSRLDVFLEACDVANIAMMIADACGAIVDDPSKLK